MTFGSYSVMLFATTKMHTVYIKQISNPLQLLLPLLRSAMLPVCLVSFNSTVTRMQSFRTIIILKLRNYHLNRIKFNGVFKFVLTEQTKVTDTVRQVDSLRRYRLCYASIAQQKF